VSYTYDLAGRLSEVRQGAAVTASYAYDANGNRLSRTDSAGSFDATYDAQDRLVQYGLATYTHTADGERRSKTVGSQTTTYRYDGLGNLIGATLPAGARIDYLLDGRDRRVGKKVNGVLAQAFLYEDGLRPIAELDGAGNVLSRFVYVGPDSTPAYLIKNNVTYRVVTDQLGSPRLVIDVATGQVVQRLEYDEFGVVILDTNPGFQPFGFAGGLYDPDTALVHFGTREYDAETGRWTSKDRFLFGGGDANLYGYVLGDPVNGVDPLGLYVGFCESGPTCAFAFDEEAVLHQQMSADEFRDRYTARLVGGLIGIVTVFAGEELVIPAVRSGWGWLFGGGGGAAMCKFDDELEDFESEVSTIEDEFAETEAWITHEASTNVEVLGTRFGEFIKTPASRGGVRLRDMFGTIRRR
jgi:RHS repeat-associated protein